MLYVLYDGECELCRRCRDWLRVQPAYVEMKFIKLQAPEVACRFPGIERWQPSRELTVVTDEGALYQGASAWIMCLYALKEYREWSFRLSDPVLSYLARRAIELISRNRLKLSDFLSMEHDDVKCP